MISNKILGYILLSVGLLIILFSLFQSYQIFTGKVSAPIIFKVSALSVTKTADSIQNQINSEVTKQLSRMIPTETIPNVLNLTVWSLLAWVLILGGGQISSLGIKLMKA